MSARKTEAVSYRILYFTSIGTVCDETIACKVIIEMLFICQINTNIIGYFSLGQPLYNSNASAPSDMGDIWSKKGNIGVIR